MKKDKAPTWTSLKPKLAEKDHAALLRLVADLFSLNEDNRRFITTRYSGSSNNMAPYRKIISDSLYPDVVENEPIKLAAGKKAISDYFKATKDKVGQLELMVYYLETGNQFTLDYGDITESFYSSLESMLDRILSALKKQPEDMNGQYLPRLRSVVESAKGIGWGYYDYMSNAIDSYENN